VNREGRRRLEWETGSIHRLEIYPWTDDVVVPTRSLKPDQVEEVLRRWYVESFRWKWGHTSGCADLRALRQRNRYPGYPELLGVGD
jgi:hypothetical protein